MTVSLVSYIKAGIAILLLSLAFWGGCSIQHSKDVAKINKVHTELTKIKVDTAEANKKHSQWIIEQERSKAAALAEIDKKNEEERERAKTNYNRTIADLRAGNLKLRERFTCPAIPSPTPSTTSISDGKTEGGLLREDEEFLISEAHRADEVVLQLDAAQKVIEEYQRKAKQK